MTNSDESKKMEGLSLGGGIKSFGTPGKMSKMQMRARANLNLGIGANSSDDRLRNIH